MECIERLEWWWRKRRCCSWDFGDREEKESVDAFRIDNLADESKKEHDDEMKQWRTTLFSTQKNTKNEDNKVLYIVQNPESSFSPFWEKDLSIILKKGERITGGGGGGRGRQVVP